MINDEDFTKLNTAVKFIDINRTKYLIEIDKIDVNVKSSYGKNVLYDLIRMKYLIIEAGCEERFNYVLAENNIIMMLNYLIEKGIDLDAQATDGMNILLFSFLYEYIEIIKFLLTHNVSLKVYNENYIEVYNKNYNFNNGIQDDCYSIIGYYPIHFAAMNGNYVLMKLLLTQGVNVDLYAKGNLPLTPLHIAILNSNYSIVKLLLSYGADPQKIINYNYTPLLLAVHAINTFSSCKPYYQYDIAIISKLLEFEFIFNNNCYTNLNEKFSIKSLLKLNNANYYIEAAKFLLDNNQHISTVAIQIIFNYAIQYKILPLAMKCLTIAKQVLNDNNIFLRFKEIISNSNLGSMFDGAVIACKYALKGSNKAKIPVEMVNNIISFSYYGNYLNSKKSHIKFNLNNSSDNLLNISNTNINNKIHARIKTIYSYSK